MYWGVKPLEARYEACAEHRNERGHAPLRCGVHDEDDLAAQLLKVVLLVARTGGLEAVERRVGHGWA